MIEIIFMEVSPELGVMVNIGQKQLNTEDTTNAHAKAKTYQEVLSDVRGNKVSYMLSKHNAILATI